MKSNQTAKHLDWEGIKIVVIAVGIVGACILSALFLPLIEYKKNCLALGSNYIYARGDSHCYRVVDDKLHYVNVAQEKALRDYLKSQD